MNIKEIALNTFQIEAEAILNLKNLLNDDFDNTVNLLFRSNGRAIITGIGKSGLIGSKIAATLASTGTPSFFMHPVEAFHGDLGVITENDIVIAISYSGKTDEILRLIPYLKEKNIPIIAITGYPDSLLAKNSIYHLNISVEKEACPLGLAPTSSTAATLAMGDALAMALIQLRNFKKEDFARFHPGGSLGYQLLTKVKDVMYEDNLPIVFPNTNINEAIFIMSKGKLGLVIVMQNENLIGIITDGDLRRAIQKYNSNIFNLLTKDIMTIEPKVVNKNIPIIDADKLMQQYNIHALIVINDNNKVVGILDSFNIIRN